MEPAVLRESQRVRRHSNVAGVVAGALLALATFNLLMALGGGLGFWTLGIFALRGLHDAGLGLALWAVLAWTAAGFVSGFVAVTVSRLFIAHDAYVYGAVTWAATCLSGLVLAWTWLICAVASGLASRDIVGAIDGRIMLVFFVANLTALGGALAGAVVGARRQTAILVASYRAHPPSP
jgi:hypothetical protein